MSKEERRDARGQFVKKLAECGADPCRCLALGKSYFLAERYGEAVEAYQKCIAINGRNAAAHYNLGVAYMAQGKYREARRAFLKALETDPNHEAAQEALQDLAAY
ncbi:MAG: tetratricopeptide repeat protein [bacterium]|nr:tetratricopeptide repeat protein [bacterium]